MPVAQLVEHRPFKAVVLGSNPSRRTNIWGIRIEVSIAGFQSADTGALPVYPTNLCPRRLTGQDTGISLL